MVHNEVQIIKSQLNHIKAIKYVHGNQSYSAQPEI